jgi:hypothetical protein
VTRTAVLLLTVALAAPALAVAADATQAPDFVGKCQAAAAKQAGVEASTVKVRGKYKGQDGRIMVDFKLADGRVGVCRSKPDASVDEVKLEDAKK